MTEDAPKRDYEVGYGRTPQHTRFKSGQSGNPRGRKKGSKNGRVLMAEELNQMILFMENGKQTKTSKLGLIIKQAANKAVKGDVKPFLELMKHFGQHVSGFKEEHSNDVLDSPEDVETRESLFQRLRGEKP